MRRGTRQAGGHQYRLGIHREVHQRATLELKDRLARVAVLRVLPARILNPLARERIFQFHRSDGNAVQAQGDIERLLGAWREMQLSGQAQTVRGVAGFEFRIQLVCRLEVRRVERSPIGT